MKKNSIQLTEAQLHQIITESVQSLLAENEEEEMFNPFSKEGRDDWKNLYNSAKQGIKAGTASAKGNFQLGRDKTDLGNYFERNGNAAARLEDIERAKRELRTQYQELVKQGKELEAYYQKMGYAGVERKPFKQSKSSQEASYGMTGNPDRFSKSLNYGATNTQGLGSGLK